MAEIDILFRVRPPKLVQIGAITVDATLSESHERSSLVTQFPVEDGSVISDHVVRDPEKVTIEGEITDTPIAIFGGILAEDYVGITDRRLEAFQQFEAIHKASEALTIVTGLKVYSDMVMANFTSARQPDTGGKLKFSAQFTHVEKVNSETTTLQRKKIAKAHKDRAGATVDIGKQATSQPNPADQETILTHFTGVGEARQ